MESITLPSGIKLTLTDDAKTATRYAISKGLAKAQVWLAEHPNGEEEYLLLIDNKPEFVSQSYEAIGAHVDMLALAVT